MSLKDYQEKRDFSKTGEPKGKISKENRPFFVIQKHQASRLHYDFRLQNEGVLKSWAIPKGPSMDPGVKRLAVRVEDHPVTYGDFEGIIPAGEYGAGSVMIWDTGPVEVPGSNEPRHIEKRISQGLIQGELGIILEGSKLKGEFILVRLHSKEANQWLFFKKNDDFAAPGSEVIAEDFSVKTGRKLEEIGRESKNDGGPRFQKEPDLSGLGLVPSKMPHLVKPMLATPVEAPFDHDQWLFEVKWDGYRAIAEVGRGEAELYSRNLKSINQIFPIIIEELKKEKKEMILDGEIVVTDAKGRSRFQGIQNYAQSGQGNLAYYVFDILYYDGYDLRGLPLEKRKEILADVLPRSETIKLSDYIVGRGEAFFDFAKKSGLEGVIAKRRDSIYRSARSANWLKIKPGARQEAVIAGFTEPRGSRPYFGALVLGVYEEGKLEYAGHTGTGFDDQTLRELHAKLVKIRRSKSPFRLRPKTNAPVTWVEPKYVAEISFTEWTKDGSMRHPVFLGLREDKEAVAVKKERPAEVGEILAEEKEPDSATANQKSERLAKSAGRNFYARKEISGEVKVGGKSVKLTNLNKIFWPEEGYTKGDLINYYRQVTRYILPYLVDRPQSLHRFPDGIQGEGFYQKNVDEDIPDWLQTTVIKSEHEGKMVNYLLCQDETSLIFLANWGCIDLNPWNSRLGKLQYPSFLVIDLDPENISFEFVIRAVWGVKAVLDRAGVASYPKTSGATGMHIYVPMAEKYDYDQVKEFARIIAYLAQAEMPDFTSVERSPVKRQGKVYLDFLQNNLGQTLASPYSVRPKPQATVSAPLSWEEVTTELRPEQFTMVNFPERLRQVGDLFGPVLKEGADLGQALDRLRSSGVDSPYL